MSSPDKGCEFSTATSGTERERGFVGTLLAGANLFEFKADGILRQKIKKLKKIVDNLKNLLYNKFCVREKVM